MDINNYIQNYDFSNYIKCLKDDFKQRPNVERYLQNNLEENFRKFSEEFWENPNISIDLLKEKYNINRQIAYSDIIKIYSSNRYIEFLKSYYNNVTIDNLIKEFAIPYNRIENLIIPVIISDSEKYCSNCFNNSFEINVSINSSSQEKVTYRCQQCNRIQVYPELLTKEDADIKMAEDVKKRAEFDEEILKCESILGEIKCPKCQEKLYIDKLDNSFEYLIRCKKCNYVSNNIEETIEAFQSWKRRAAMMIAIKAKEQELIEKTLESKKEKDIIFVKEDIIENSENNKTLAFFQTTSKMDNIQLWREVLTRIKSCNRLEKILLSKIIKLAKGQADKKIISLGVENVSIYA